MKKLLLAVIAMMGIAGAETLTGKIILSGRDVSSVSAQVCMNGPCADIKDGGEFSLTVGSSGIQNSERAIGSDLYRSGRSLSPSGQL